MNKKLSLNTFRNCFDSFDNLETKEKKMSTGIENNMYEVYGSDLDFLTFEEAVANAKQRAAERGKRFSILKKIAYADPTKLVESIEIVNV